VVNLTSRSPILDGDSDFADAGETVADRQRTIDPKKWLPLPPPTTTTPKGGGAGREGEGEVAG